MSENRINGTGLEEAPVTEPVADPDPATELASFRRSVAVLCDQFAVDLVAVPALTPEGRVVARIEAIRRSSR